MAETEGVIQYRLEHEHRESLPLPDLASLNAWRSILWRLRLLGQSPQRYGGLGFGNLSQRAPRPGQPAAFIISGSQTGHLETLTPHHYAWVLSAEPESNCLHSQGPIKPSSEALTHAAVYAALPAVGCVMHVHSPEIWQATQALGLPGTGPEAGYGSVALARAVSALLAEEKVRRRQLLSMRGHRDGIIAFGSTTQEAGQVLIRTLAQALELTPRPEL